MSFSRRILIVQPYGIGDLLFLTPVLRALRLIPTVERVDLLLGSRTESVVRSNPHINKIFVMDRGRAQRQNFQQNLKELWVLGKELQKQKHDLLLDYSLRGEYAFFSQFFLGIPRRAGFAYKNRGFFHNLRVPLPEGFKNKHVVDFVCEVAEKAGVRVEDRFLEFYTDSSSREAAEAFLHQKNEGYVVVSPGGGESWGADAHFKRWPADFFSIFLNQLQEKIPFEKVLILGSQGERELAETLVSGLKMPAVNACGELSLETSAALIEKSQLFVGNDGGLVHLACALHKPVIAFYGPVAPAVYGPYPEHPERIAIYKENLDCRPCYQKFRYNNSCQTRECLQNLKPEEAMEFLQKRNYFEKINAHTAKP